MSWQAYALLAMVSMGFFVLFQKITLNLKTSVNKFVFWVFVGYFLGCLLLRFTSLEALVRSELFWLFILVGLGAAILSLFGNINDVAAMKSVPNPGYVQAIKNGNSPIILLALLAFFGARFVWWGLFGVVFIALGLLFLLSRKKEDYQKGSWLRSAIVGTFCFAGMIILINVLIAFGYKDPIQNLMVLSLFVPLAMAAIIAREQEGFFNFPKKALFAFIPAVIVGLVANVLSYQAMALAKGVGANAGWTQAIFNAQSLLVFGLAAFTSRVFPGLLPKEKGGEFNLKELIGICLVVLGVGLIVYFTRK